MSKIKLLVEIDEDDYKAICSDKGYSYANTMWWIIRNGTPLPKGHGRLIDIDNIESIMLEDSVNRMVHTKGDEVDWYIEAPTIFEADKENDNG